MCFFPFPGLPRSPRRVYFWSPIPLQWDPMKILGFEFFWTLFFPPFGALSVCPLCTPNKGFFFFFFALEFLPHICVWVQNKTNRNITFSTYYLTHRLLIIVGINMLISPAWWARTTVSKDFSQFGNTCNVELMSDGISREASAAVDEM